MYALLLAFRYLRTRLIPLVAIGAVGLCVALVVVVVSIMSASCIRWSGREDAYW